MAVAAHLLRRNAVYYWRRKIPRELVDCQNRKHLLLSLRTLRPDHARSLGRQLDAFLDDLTHMPDAHFLTQTQLDGMLRDVLTKHLAKLERIAAAAKLSKGFDREQAERDDKRTAWAFRLLDAQGPYANVSDADREAILADGFDMKELGSIIDHLARLQDGGSVPTKPHILRPLLEAQNAEPTAMNLAQAQQIYFRGLKLALQQSGGRYRGEHVDDALLVERLIKQEIASRVDALADAAIARQGSKTTTDASPVASANALETTNTTSKGANGVDDRPTSLGAGLHRKREKESDWDEKTANQATRLYRLFEKFLAEDFGVSGLLALRQTHLAKFINFLQFEVYKHYGKSAADHMRSIAELRKIAESKAPKLRGVEAGTLNRHLTFLNQLLAYARSQGLRLDPDLSTTLLRASNTDEDRARNARPTLKSDAASLVFAAAPFTGCASWETPLEPGDAIYHRALYYVPLLLYYQGGRREEFCGLEVEDVVVDSGSIPYIHVTPNGLRRLKNAQSQRYSPLHPELLRLNFLAYVNQVKTLGYRRLFPDLYSPTTKSPLGDRFYDEFKPVLTAADTNEAGFVIHSLRRGFGDALKQKKVTDEQRGDLLGHVGKSEASERYCDAYELQTLYEFILKIPIVTQLLATNPIRLLPWVEAGQIAPFSRQPRKPSK